MRVSGKSFILEGQGSKKREEVCVVGTLVFYFLSGIDIILSTSGRDTIIHTTSVHSLIIYQPRSASITHACQRQVIFGLV